MVAATNLLEYRNIFVEEVKEAYDITGLVLNLLFHIIGPINTVNIFYVHAQVPVFQPNRLQPTGYE